MGEDGPDPRVPLGDRGWYLWRDVGLRGAGFPADRLLAICDQELAAAADGLDGTTAGRELYDKEYAAATERLSLAIRETAREATFREAISWQNPQLVTDCLDRAAAGERRNVRGRNHELAIVSYLQRYCLKNDTIGFFGPVGWARVRPDQDAFSVEPGSTLLSRRTTYFEFWAIDVLAERLAARPELWPWLAPRRPRSSMIADDALWLPLRKPVPLQAFDLRLLERCDGRRTVRDLAGDPPDPQTQVALLRLRDLGALEIGLGYEVTRWPERGLAEQLDRIGDPGVRSRALAPVAEMIAARDRVSAAAGDPDRLRQATGGLEKVFERITGTASSRLAGTMYAGRTLVYEDAVRAGDVRLGRQITDALAGPLGLLLDSATWLVNTVAQRYRETFLRVVDRVSAGPGGDGDAGLPLLRLLILTMPEVLVGSTEFSSETVDAAVVEFQERWGRVLEVPSGARRCRFAGAAIEAAVASEFATGPSLWSCGRRHSPDVMIAATGPEAIRRGDFELVLGELHLASNTLENRLFLAQHPDPLRLRRASEADDLQGRVVAVPLRDAQQVTTRLSRSTELMLDGYTYLSIGKESVPVPPAATVISAVDLMVRRRGDGLVVQRVSNGREYPFLEVIGDFLTLLVANAFHPFALAAHRPRVSIDQLVVARESWTFGAQDLAWAFVKDEQQRYLQARRWRGAHGIPEQAFTVAPGERKPVAVDFRSLPLVNLLAKVIRRTAEIGPGRVTVSEMLPDREGLWLQDAQGQRYTSELRFVAVRG